MKIQILEKNGNEIKFLVEGISAAFANALRRVMMTEVPTMAIEWVDFKKNDSALSDEIVANRLGQVPLTFDKHVYNLPSECKCEGKGCSRCQVKLTLKKKGPDMVYSEDLKSRTKDVKAVFDKIPIVELFEGQEIEFEATAQLGIGKEHAKWQAANVGYSNLPNITIDSKKCKGCSTCVKKCVKKILKIENDKLVVTDPLACNVCLQCVDACPDGAIKVGTEDDKFIFNVETVSGISAEEVVLDAADALENKINDFAKSLRKVK